MKAAEYAQKFNDATDKRAALNEIARGFLLDTRDIILHRKPTTDAAGKAIIIEINDKWKAFARRTGIDADGYYKILKAQMPEIAPFL